MFDDLFRSLKDRWSAPLARWLAPHVHPDAITLGALVAGLGTAVLIVFGWYRTAAAAWLFNRLLDGLDGSVARVGGRGSDFGGYLDVVLDFVVYAAIPIALVLRDPAPEVWWGALLLFAGFYVNAASWMMLSAVLERRGEGAAARGEVTAVTMPGGVVAGTETVLFYTSFLLWPAAVAPLFLAMALLVLLNVVLRLHWAWRHLR